MPHSATPLESIRAEFQNRHSGLLTDLLSQYTRYVEESPPLGQRQMPERLQHLLRMIRVTGRNFLNEREGQVQATGMSRDEVLVLIEDDADDWLHQHGPQQDPWLAPFRELETAVPKR